MATPATNSRRLTLPAVLVAFFVSQLHAQVPEPETVFYGRVVNRTSGQELQVNSGTLSFTITGVGVVPLVVTTELQPYSGGKFSYVIRVPHQAKSSDLAVENGRLPLLTADTGYDSSTITVDGQTARPLGTATAEFIASQARRGGVHRLDLELFNTLEDTDRDGIPDWWEDLYGLDKQDRSDALQRWGSGAYTYFDAFRLGLDPSANDSIPKLLTTEVTVLEKGSTGLLLRAQASGLAPAQISYSVTRLPEGGDLVLRNARPDPKRPHRLMRAGDSFTQADVDAGLLEFVHRESSVAMTRLELAISTRNTAVAPVEGSVQFNVFRLDAADGLAGQAALSAVDSGAEKPASSAADMWRKRATKAFESEWTGGRRQQDWIAATLLSRWFDFTVWEGTRELPVMNLRVPSAGMTSQQYDALYVRPFGKARRHVLFGGGASVRLDGGMSDDILIAGSGETTVKGNAGADIFVGSEGTLIVEDFKPAEGDFIDISPLLKGWTGPFGNKVNVSFNAGNTWLRIPLSASAEAAVVLKGLNISAERLESMRKRRQIFSGQQVESSEIANAAPVANPDEGYVTAGQMTTLPVLANDTDPDGDALAIKSATQGTYGTVQVVDDVIVYNPGPAFSGSDEFTYTVVDGIGGFADGVVRICYPFPAAAGKYVSLVSASDGTPMGQLVVTVQRGGKFTVSFRSGRAVWSGRGEFDVAGAATVSLRSGRQSVQISLSLDLQDDDHPLVATVTGDAGSGTTAQTLVSAASSLLRSVPRRFNIAGVVSGVTDYSGYGAVTVAISASYSATLAGRMPDGTPFTATAVQDKLGGVSWSASLYKGGGWATGILSLNPTGSTATMRWFRPAIAGQDAFSKELVSQISPYQAPSVASVSALDFTDLTARNATLQVDGGGLSAPVSATAVFADRDKIKAGDPFRTLVLNRLNGVLTGSVTVDGKARPVFGIILQNSNTGFGLVQNPASSGTFKLLPQ